MPNLGNSVNHEFRVFVCRIELVWECASYEEGFTEGICRMALSRCGRRQPKPPPQGEAENRALAEGTAFAGMDTLYPLHGSLKVRQAIAKASTVGGGGPP